MTDILPIGKIPRDLLERLLAQAPTQDPQIMLGPGIGLGCAVVEVGDTLLVVKSDPITFAADAIGWYADSSRTRGSRHSLCRYRRSRRRPNYCLEDGGGRT